MDLILQSDDCMFDILLHCAPRDICVMNQVCRSIAKVCDEYFWRTKCINDYDDIMKPDDFSWKKYCIWRLHDPVIVCYTTSDDHYHCPALLNIWNSSSHDDRSVVDTIRNIYYNVRFVMINAYDRQGNYDENG